MKKIFSFRLSLLAMCWTAIATANGAVPPPNIVFILADDLGWSDLGCYGGDLVETPRIDGLAHESVRFTHAYAMPLCSPTRAALLTGQNPARLRLTTIMEVAAKGVQKNRLLLGAETLPYLRHEHQTIASYLHRSGYLTALIGKWHLGDADYYPETHGFDMNIGGTRWGSPHTFFWPYSGIGQFEPGEFRYVPHLEFGHEGEYLTDRLTDEALKVIDRAGTQPFFLYLAHHAPHLPMEAKADDVAHFEGKLGSSLHHKNAVYAAMIKTLDESVGRVIDRLEERGLTKNTLFIFASDNGGEIRPDRRQKGSIPITDNAPLRSGKGTLYEGGIRVPLIVRWPGVTPADQKCDEPVQIEDLFYTMRHAGLSNSPRPLPSDVDGMDLTPLLKTPSGTLTRDALYFHFPHYNLSTPAGAILARDWKLLEYFEDNHVELYNLREDVSEEHDVAAKMPAKAAELRAKLHAWRQSVDAAMPMPNPDFGAKKKNSAKLAK